MKIHNAGSYKETRRLCRKVKEGNLKALDEAAEALSSILPENSVLVPMPGRFGYAAYTLMLAIRIAMKRGFEVENCLRGETRNGLCETKREGKKPTEPKFWKQYRPTKGKRHVLIDNVYDTGTTARAAEKAMGKKCDIAVIGITKADKNKSKKQKNMETVTIRKSESGRMPVAAISKSGRVPVDAQSKSGRVPMDGKNRSGRVQLDGKSKSGRMQLDGKIGSGRVPMDGVRIIHPEPYERETAQQYFRFYSPAFGEKLQSVQIGVDAHGTASKAIPGDMVYYNVIAELPPTLYGPYRILDIRRIRLQDPHVYLDRFDFMMPVLPTRLCRESIVEPYDTG
jgi:hypothetical protein